MKDQIKILEEDLNRAKTELKTAEKDRETTAENPKRLEQVQNEAQVLGEELKRPKNNWSNLKQ